MRNTSKSLAELLTLRATGPNQFRAEASRTSGRRLFGGQVAGQALIAAGRTVPAARTVHSVHAHFLRAGDATRPLDYHVDPVRDGASFSTRRVVALQGETEVFALTASFHVAEDGWEHQIPRSPGTDPDCLPPGAEAMAAAGEHNLAWFEAITSTMPVDIRFDGALPRLATVRGEAAAPRQRFWVRSRDPLPADELTHAGAVAYISDVFLLSAALGPHATFIGSPGLGFASLDHAVWFHRAVRADEWLHYDQEGIWAGRGRALCRGLLFDRDGELVASMTQEALIRRLPEPVR